MDRQLQQSSFWAVGTPSFGRLCDENVRTRRRLRVHESGFCGDAEARSGIVATATKLRAMCPKVRQGSRRDTWGETGFAGLLGSESAEYLDR